jgi:ATP-dependent Clp protease ATP-binding subunit ClpA
MLERFTSTARAVVTDARDEARDLRHPQIGTEHFLLALLNEETGGAYAVLHAAGVEKEAVREEIKKLVVRPTPLLTDADAEALKTIGIDLEAVLANIERSLGPDAWVPVIPPDRERRGLLRRRQQERTVPRRSRFGPRAKKVLELSVREAIRLHADKIGTEHLLLGVIREGEGLAARILVDAGVDLTQLREATLDQLRKAA